MRFKSEYYSYQFAVIIFNDAFMHDANKTAAIEGRGRHENL